MARSSYIALSVAAWLAGGCRVDADVDGVQLACETECPGDLACVQGRCVEPIVADAAVDAPAIDAAACECTADSFADDCGANLEDISAGARICASTENNTNAVLGCPGAPTPGLDAAFRVAADAGQTITATVRPEGFDAAIYIARDCSGAACDARADDAGVSGTETATVVAPVSGDYFIIVDSPSGAGCYELDVTVE